jgi:hypothetical protein
MVVVAATAEAPTTAVPLTAGVATDAAMGTTAGATVTPVCMVGEEMLAATGTTAGVTVALPAVMTAG